MPAERLGISDMVLIAEWPAARLDIADWNVSDGLDARGEAWCLRRSYLLFVGPRDGFIIPTTRPSRFFSGREEIMEEEEKQPSLITSVETFK